MRLRHLTHPTLLLTSVLLAACATPPDAGSCDFTALAASQPDASATLALLRSVHRSPLYAQAIAPSGQASCRAQRDNSTLSLLIQSAGGNSLRIKHDPRLEYTSQEASFVTPPTEPALKTLAHAERAAFGANGCGIDWKNAETLMQQSEPGTEDAIYRGDVCNCQARVRRNAAGVVTQLSLGSIC